MTKMLAGLPPYSAMWWYVQAKAWATSTSCAGKMVKFIGRCSFPAMFFLGPSAAWAMLVVAAGEG